MVFIWLLAGMLGIAAAFLIPDSSMDLWPALNSAGVALAVYLIALAVFMLRPPLPLRKRLIAGLVAAVWIISVASLWTGHQTQAEYQRDQLITIRSTIGRGIILDQVPAAIMPVLEDYYAQGQRRKMSIGDLFGQRYPHAVAGENFREPMWEGDTQGVFIPARLENDVVEIIAVDRVGRGKDPAFANTGGTVGRIEERFVLTAKGVSHDILN